MGLSSTFIYQLLSDTSQVRALCLKPFICLEEGVFVMQSLSKNMTVIAAFALIPGVLLIMMSGLGLRQGRQMLFARKGESPTLTGPSARVYSALFMIAGLLITLPGLLIVFRVFFDISTDLMAVIMLAGGGLFVISNILGLMAWSRENH
jgi:hypothetical protein